MRGFVRRIVSFSFIAALALPAVAADAPAPTFKNAAERDAKLIEGRVERAVRSLTTQLELDESQADSLRPLLADHYRQVRASAAQPSSLPREQARARRAEAIQASRESLYVALAEVMTPAQLEQFKQLQMRNKMRSLLAQEPE